jgi:hypothetical protein
MQSLRNGGQFTRPGTEARGRHRIRRCDIHNLTQDHLDYHGTMENYLAQGKVVHEDHERRQARRWW